MNLILIPFDEKQAGVIRPWFDDPETKKWLGDRSWVDNIFRLLKEPSGTEFKGERKIAFYAFAVYDNDEPIGFIDGGIVDRWVKYGGESDGKPIYLDFEEKITSNITFLVNPSQRRKGYGTAMVKALLQRPEYKKVEIFAAGVDPKNIGSIKTLEATGFNSDYQPDFEDMLYFFYRM